MFDAMIARKRTFWNLLFGHCSTVVGLIHNCCKQKGCELPAAA
eukprot:SAG11_NODE_34138_length_273_cov_1.298851_1_plen_42_part_10